MELWDIYDADKKPTGRTMKRNDWCLKNGEYHLTVLGVVARPDVKIILMREPERSVRMSHWNFMRRARKSILSSEQ